ncbi:MAG: SGNH/GDSL hydrolase family protein [Patescibacteria group bacterium]
MNKWLLLGGVLVLGLGVTVYLLGPRTLLTVWLILRVTPYEQPGTGGGSVLVLGDSTGYGTGATTGSASIAGRLGADYPALTVKNLSVNGDTIADAVARAQALDEQYDLILLQLGGNDILQLRPVEAVQADTERLLAVLAPHTERMVLMSAGNVGAARAFSGETADRYTEHSQRYHAAMEELAAARPELTYVNLYEPPHSDPFVSQPDIYHALDGLHPSDAGYAAWYEKLRPVLAAQLSVVAP